MFCLAIKIEALNEEKKYFCATHLLDPAGYLSNAAERYQKDMNNDVPVP
jgi:hypothetical protein